MEFFKVIGNNILTILKEKGITQTDLADAIGVSKQVIGKIIKGQKAINALEIKNISNALNVSIDRLIEENKDDIPEKEPILMFMGEVKDESRDGIKFLNNVINELIIMEEALND